MSIIIRLFAAEKIPKSSIESPLATTTVNRKPKNGRNCCSRSCAAKIVKNRYKGNSDITKFSGNKRDEYTPFRYFMIGIRTRVSDQKSYNLRGFDIDEKYLNHTMDKLKLQIEDMESSLVGSKIWKIWLKTYPDTFNFNSRAQLGEVLFNKM